MGEVLGRGFRPLKLNDGSTPWRISRERELVAGEDFWASYNRAYRRIKPKRQKSLRKYVEGEGGIGMEYDKYYPKLVEVELADLSDSDEGVGGGSDLES